MEGALEAKIRGLEEKVRVLARAMNLILMEGEELSEEEVNEVKRRLNDWLKGNKGEFVSLDEAVQSSSP